MNDDVRTSLASAASAMISIHPLNVAYESRGVVNAIGSWPTGICTHDLKQCEIPIDHIIEIDARILPGEILAQTIGFVRHVLRDIHTIVRVQIDALVEPSAEQLNAHDREDQPENQTHEQNVENGRNGTDQGIDHDLNGSTRQVSNGIGKCGRVLECRRISTGLSEVVGLAAFAWI